MITDAIATRALKINPVHPRDPALAAMLGLGQTTTAGVDVSEETSMNYSAVYAAVRCISETLALLPLHVYQKSGEDRERLEGHPVSHVLKQPNPNMTRMVFRETLQRDLLLWGNAYAEIVRNRLGQPVELWPRHPSRVVVERTDNGRLRYRITNGEQEAILDAQNVLHVPNLGSGELGESVIWHARESIGAALAAEQYGAGFFGNGAKPGGILKMSRAMSREQKQTIAEQWDQHFQGGTNVGRLAVIGVDADYQSIGIPPEDAQFLETRLFQVQEVCRWFRISPTKLMDFSHATFSNIEEINRAYAGETILPWAERWEQEYERKLLEDDNLFIEHDLAGLLEGDIETQANMFAQARQNGWMNLNQIRRKLNMNGIGPDGDVYMSPGNLLPIDKFGEEPEPQPDQEPIQPEPREDEEPEERAGLRSPDELRDFWSRNAVRHLMEHYDAKVSCERKHNDGTVPEKQLDKLHQRFISDLRKLQLERKAADQWLEEIQNADRTQSDQGT